MAYAGNFPEVNDEKGSSITIARRVNKVKPQSEPMPIRLGEAYLVRTSSQNVSQRKQQNCIRGDFHTSAGLH